jgi:hypothetical protein
MLMTTAEFRALALSFPETEERAHMNHPDFRVGGKVFATISPEGLRGMVKLPLDQQEFFLRTEPAVFEPASGAWGRGGATMINLDSAEASSVRRAVNAAWRNVAPKKVIDRYDDNV